MEKTIAKLTVFFEDPFWVGVYERECGGRYEACRIVFGAEPKDYEVYDFMLKNWNRFRFSPSIRIRRSLEQTVNPKRMQREIRKQLLEKGAGTKSQQALSLMREEGKQQRQTDARQKREQDKEPRFLLRQEKRKEKHRGR